MKLRSLLALALALGAAWVPSLAHAGGFELAAPGTRSLGRGGAFLARADDPMALGYNPAALAFLPGTQLQLGSHLILADSCATRAGTYNDSDVLNSGSGFDSRFGYAESTPSNWVNQPFPEICRGFTPGPSPQLVFSAHPMPGLGFALGFLAPSGVGSSSWGDEDGTITRDDGLVLPTPVRYAGIRSNLLLFHISAGVGYSPIPELSFGLTLQWGISTVSFTTFTSIGSGAQDPAQDIRTQLEVVDYFVPAGILSVHAVPIPQLDIAVFGRYSDGINADGTLDLTTGFYGTSMDGSYTPFTSRVDGVNLNTAQPFTFGLGIRYSDQRSPQGRHRDPDEAGRINGRVEDPMQTENFDLELDFIYSFNDPVNDFVVTNPDGASVGICEAPRDCAADGPSFSAPVPQRIPLARGWGDQLIVRAGGDWNIFPGLFAMRAGAHFETSGVNPNYQVQDFINGMRLGLHLGATLRIDRFDVSIAYAHVFQFTETITDARYRHTAATGTEGICPGPDGAVYDPDNPVVDRGCYPRGAGSIINAGTYTADFNLVSLSARYHFN